MILGGLGTMIGASMVVGVMFVFGFLSIGLVALLTVLALALMIMAFVGAYCTFRKRCFTLALAGAICSAMSIAFLAGVLAAVFLALRESEFDGRGAKERLP